MFCFFFLFFFLLELKQPIQDSEAINESESETDSHSVVPLFETPWTVACQAILSMGILQTRILEWVAMPSSRGFSWSKDWTWSSAARALVGSFIIIIIFFFFYHVSCLGSPNESTKAKIRRMAEVDSMERMKRHSGLDHQAIFRIA